MLRVALVTISILAREMRLKFFEVDQRLEMLRVPPVTIVARKMRLKFFWSRPSFGDVARAASHHYWREKCDWKFFQVDQALEMLRVRLVMILERFSKPNIRFGSGRTGSKIVSKFRLTHNRKLRSANRNTICPTISCPALLLWCLAVM